MKLNSKECNLVISETNPKSNMSNNLYRKKPEPNSLKLSNIKKDKKKRIIQETETDKEKDKKTETEMSTRFKPRKSMSITWMI